MWHTEIRNYGSFFALYSPPKNPKNQNFEKMKTIAGDIITLHKFIKNHNPMRNSFWDLEWDRQNILSFSAISWHFTTLTTGKIKILKQWKKHLGISSLYTCVPKITIIWCMPPEIENTTDIFFCHFGPFFALLPHYWPKNKILEEIKKNSLRYYPITHVYHTWRSYDVWFLRYKKRQNFLSLWVIFCPLTLITTWKIKILKKF